MYVKKQQSMYLNMMYVKKQHALCVKFDLYYTLLKVKMRQWLIEMDWGSYEEVEGGRNIINRGYNRGGW